MKRKIIEINEEKCTGCGKCIPGCPEGALQIIDGKARLISDLSCDGLGACIGQCPEGALTVVEREAEPYDEEKVMENIVKQGSNTIQAHLEHLRSHREMEYLKQAILYLKERDVKTDFDPSQYLKFSPASFCPSNMARKIERKTDKIEQDKAGNVESEINSWPIQLALLNPLVPFLQNSDLLIAADCVPFACANFHSQFLKGKVLIIFCPKLDTDKVEGYIQKLTNIFKVNTIKSVTVVHMEVPCCMGSVRILEEAIKRSGKKIEFQEHTISIRGETLA